MHTQICYLLQYSAQCMSRLTDTYRCWSASSQCRSTSAHSRSMDRHTCSLCCFSGRGSILHAAAPQCIQEASRNALQHTAHVDAGRNMVWHRQAGFQDDLTSQEWRHHRQWERLAQTAQRKQRSSREQYVQPVLAAQEALPVTGRTKAPSPVLKVCTGPISAPRSSDSHDSRVSLTHISRSLHAVQLPNEPCP